MENNKNQIISINSSLANFERQIAIGEKLLGINLTNIEKDQIKEFLVETVSDNYNIVDIISGYFPLTWEIIEIFKDKLNWGRLCNNDYLVWTEEWIDKYFAFIDWESLSENSKMEWDLNLLDKYADYLNFNYIFTSDVDLKLTSDIFAKFKDKIDTEYLNDIDFEYPISFIKDNNAILEWKDLDTYTIEILESFQGNIDWKELSESKKLIVTDELIKRFKHKWTWRDIIKIKRKNGTSTFIRICDTYYKSQTYTNIYYDADVIIDEEFLDQIESGFFWSHLSRDTNFINNNLLLEKFKNNWDWTTLTYNGSVEWTPDLIEKYKDKIDWEVLSLNPYLDWSEELIDKYYDYWSWKILGLNTTLIWNVDFYKKHEYKFRKDFLFFYKEPAFHLDDVYKSNYDILNYFVDYHHFRIIPKFSFNSNLIFYVKDILNWNLFSQYYEWSESEIENYKGLINWSELSRNININWSAELLRNYEDKWDWEQIGWNKSVVNFELSSLKTYVNYLKTKGDISHRYPVKKIRILFLNAIGENDVIDILYNHNSPKAIAHSK